MAHESLLFAAALVVAEGVEDLVGDHAAGEAERGATDHARGDDTHARATVPLVVLLPVVAVRGMPVGGLP